MYILNLQFVSIYNEFWLQYTFVLLVHFWCVNVIFFGCVGGATELLIDRQNQVINANIQRKDLNISVQEMEWLYGLLTMHYG